MGLFTRFQLRSFETNLGQKTGDEILKTVRADLARWFKQDRKAFNDIQKQELRTTSRFACNRKDAVRAPVG